MREVPIRNFNALANNIIRANQPNTKTGVSSCAFRSFFGTSPKTCASLWKISNFPSKTRPKHLMWALMFLKSYDTEIKLSSLAGVSPKTFRKWIWVIIDEIGKTMHKVVSFYCNLL